MLGFKIRTKYSKRKFEDILTQSRFKIIESKIYKTVYKYTLEEFIKLLQTYSIWNDVPTSKRRHILKLFRNHYGTMLKNGLIYGLITGVGYVGLANLGTLDPFIPALLFGNLIHSTSLRINTERS